MNNPSSSTPTPAAITDEQVALGLERLLDESIFDYVDGRLAEPDRAAMQQLIERNPVVRRRVQDYQAVLAEHSPEGWAEETRRTLVKLGILDESAPEPEPEPETTPEPQRWLRGKLTALSQTAGLAMADLADELAACVTALLGGRVAVLATRRGADQPAVPQQLPTLQESYEISLGVLRISRARPTEKLRMISTDGQSFVLERTGDHWTLRAPPDQPLVIGALGVALPPGGTLPLSSAQLSAW